MPYAKQHGTFFLTVGMDAAALQYIAAGQEKPDEVHGMLIEMSFILLLVPVVQLVIIAQHVGHGIIDGQEEMFSDGDYTTNLLNDMRIHYHLTIADEKLLRGYLQLDERERKVITDFIKKSADEIRTAEASIDEKVEAYRRQLIAQAEE